MGKGDLNSRRPYMPRKGSIRDQEWPEGQLFYIQDGRQVVGNCIVFWREDGQGYSSDLKQAWRIPYEKALAIEQGRESEILWPCDIIDAHAKIHIDIQDLRRLQESGRRAAPPYPNFEDGL